MVTTRPSPTGFGSQFNSSGARIAVVTGGNKGIGLEVCRQLAAGGLTVVLTARDETRGAAAAEKLREQGLSGVVIFHQLEITDASSIARLVEFLKTHFGRLDILVNNAAVGGTELVDDPSFGPKPEGEQFSGMDYQQRIGWMWRNCRETYDTAKEGLHTNYYGTKQHFRGEELKQELNDGDNLTEERLDELMETFLKDLEAGASEVRGWPSEFASYKVAKAAVNAYSRIMARRHPALRVNCAHPGFVKTDMTRNAGLLTPQEGASNVVKVALLPAGGPTCAFFALGAEASFI
ncbi:hypothetical protein U9M48_041686 [Paspalum notatum var. saurae]|uniref:(+)-neomenthol dehydrogenase n=1 Tax=Paspalum notatum var. saurae TaxID=547442 RepID=A0AAQ3UR02_PASNO